MMRILDEHLIILIYLILLYYASKILLLPIKKLKSKDTKKYKDFTFILFRSCYKQVSIITENRG